jgi:hypothetical protein
VSWKPGQAEILSAIDKGEVQQVTGGHAAGEGWLIDARRKRETARSYPGEKVEPHELAEAIASAQQIIQGAEHLLPTCPSLPGPDFPGT